mgnify:FL=1
MDREELIEMLDGEAEIVSEGGQFCFNHMIFLNGDCIECGVDINNLNQTKEKEG